MSGMFNCPEHGLAYGWHCPRCHPPTPGHYATIPQGCICPPTSEQTCQNPTCPRKNPFKGATV